MTCKHVFLNIVENHLQISTPLSHLNIRSENEGKSSVCFVLQGLRAEVPSGQALFQQLMGLWQTEAGGDDVGMEELRYKWMLYKSKLMDTENVKVCKVLERVTIRHL